MKLEKKIKKMIKGLKTVVIWKNEDQILNKKNKGRININWFKGKIKKNQIFDQKYQNKNPKKKNKIKHEAKTK